MNNFNDPENTKAILQNNQNATNSLMNEHENKKKEENTQDEQNLSKEGEKSSPIAFDGFDLDKFDQLVEAPVQKKENLQTNPFLKKPVKNTNLEISHQITNLMLQDMTILKKNEVEGLPRTSVNKPNEKTLKRNVTQYKKQEKCPIESNEDAENKNPVKAEPQKTLKEICDSYDKEIKEPTDLEVDYLKIHERLKNQKKTQIIGGLQCDVGEEIKTVFLAPFSEIYYLTSKGNVVPVKYEKTKSTKLSSIDTNALYQNVDCLTIAPDGKIIFADNKYIRIKFPKKMTEYLTKISNKNPKSKDSGFVGFDFEHGLYSEKITNLVVDAKSSLILSSSDGQNKYKIWVWNINETEKTFILTTDQEFDAVKSLAFFSNGEHIVSGHACGAIKIWSLVSKKDIRTFGETKKKSVIALLVVSETQIISGYKDNDIIIWNSQESFKFDEKNASNNIIKVSSSTFSLSLIPSSSYFLSTHDNKLMVWNIKNGQKVCTFDGSKTAFISSDGLKLFSAKKNQLLQWDIAVPSGEFFLDPNKASSKGGITQLLIGKQKNSNLIISSDVSQCVRIWDAISSQLINKIDNIGKLGHKNPIAVFDDLTKIVSLQKDSDNILEIWDTTYGESQYPPLVEHKTPVYNIVMGKNNTIYSADQNGKIIKWKLLEENKIKDLEKKKTIKIEDKTIVDNKENKTPTLKEKEKKFYVPEAIGTHENNMCLATFYDKSKDFLASGSTDGTIHFWINDILLKQYKEAGHTQEVTSIAFMQYDIGAGGDKIIMISGGLDGKIILWDTDEPWEIKQVFNNNNPVKCLSTFELAGQKIIFSEDKKFKILKINLQNFELSSIVEETQNFNITSISIIKSKIYIGGDDNKIRIFDAEKMLSNMEKQVFMVGERPDELRNIDAIIYSVINESSQIVSAIGKNLTIWDIEKMKSVQILPIKHNSSVKLLAISKKESKYMITADAQRLFLWNFEQKKFIKEIEWKEPKEIKEVKDGKESQGVQVVKEPKNSKEKETMSKKLPLPDKLEIYKNLVICFLQAKNKKDQKIAIFQISDPKTPEKIFIFNLNLTKESQIKPDEKQKESQSRQIESIKIIEIDKTIRLYTAGSIKIGNEAAKGVINYYDILVKGDEITLNLVEEMRTNIYIPTIIDFSPNNDKTVIAVNKNSTITWWDTSTDSYLAKIDIDFEVKSFSFLPCGKDKRQLGFINNLLFDFQNYEFLNIRKWNSEKNSQIFYLQNNDYILVNDYYKVEKYNNIFCTNSYLNILASINSVSDLIKLYNNVQTEELTKENEVIFPYYFNYLHLVALTGNKEPFCIKELSNLKPDIGVFLAKNIKNDDCFNMTEDNMQETNKETFKKLIDLFINTLGDENTSANDKIRYFSNSKKDYQTDFKFLEKAYDFYGAKTLEKLLDHTILNNDEFVQGIELSEMESPVFLILENLHPLNQNDLKQKLIKENMKNKLGYIRKSINWIKGIFIKKDYSERLIRRYTINDENSEDTGVDNYKYEKGILVNVKCSFICLENLVEINDKVVKFIDLILKEDPKNQIFCNQVLKMVANYKWNTYGFGIFIRQFLIFIFMFLLYFINFFYFFIDRITYQDQISEANIVVSCFLDLTLLVYIISYIWAEIQEFREVKLDYLTSLYNWIDVFLIVFTIGALALDFMYMFSIIDDVSVLQIFISISIFSFWMRVISFLRGIEGTSFMINLIVQVVKDIKYFLLLMLLFHFSFDCSAYFLQSFDVNNSYSFFSLFTNFYRLMLGDFTDYDEYSTVTNSYCLWFVMLLFTVLIVIILLNLLISIISDSFQNVYKLKAQTRTYELMTLINDIDRRLNLSSEKEVLRNKCKIGNYLFKFYTENEEIEKDSSIETYDAVLRIEKLLKNFVQEMRPSVLQSPKKGNYKSEVTFN